MALSREEMLKLLDLNAKSPRVASPAKDGGLLARKPKLVPVDPSKDTTPNALTNIDEWVNRRGREIAESFLRENTWDSEIQASKGSAHFDLADFFGACYLCDPAVVEDGACSDPYKQSFMKELLDSTTHRANRTDTELNDAASQVAAISIYESFLKSRRKGRTTGTAAEDAAGDAADSIEELEGSMIAAGMGYGAKSKEGKLDPEKVIALYDRVRKNESLRRIFDLAGRMRRFGQSQQKKKTVHGSEDLIGVTLGDDISRLVSNEQANLCIPILKADTVRRIVEKQAMIKHLVNHEPIAKGPVLIVVDESGSMSGRKVEEAKALALAMAWIARSQDRWCGLIAYSGGTGHRILSLPPGRWDEMALCDWLQAFISGGSYLDLPIRELPEFYQQIGAPHGKTDIVMCTDAICTISQNDQDTFNTWRKVVKARVTSFIIRNEAWNLESICDECFSVNGINLGEDGVKNALAF